MNLLEVNFEIENRFALVAAYTADFGIRFRVLVGLPLRVIEEGVSYCVCGD